MAELPLRGLIDDIASPIGDYLVLQDILDAKGLKWLVDVTDDNATGTYDGRILVSLAARAEGMVNLYLAGRYAVPLTLTSLPAHTIQTVKRWTLCLLVYLLAERRDATDRSVADDYNQCLAELKMMRDGELFLPGGSPRTDVMLHNHTTRDTTPFLTTKRATGGSWEPGETGNLDDL